MENISVCAFPYYFGAFHFCAFPWLLLNSTRRQLPDWQSVPRENTDIIFYFQGRETESFGRLPNYKFCPDFNLSATDWLHSHDYLFHNLDFDVAAF